MLNNDSRFMENIINKYSKNKKPVKNSKFSSRMILQKGGRKKRLIKGESSETYKTITISQYSNSMISMSRNQNILLKQYNMIKVL